MQPKALETREGEPKVEAAAAARGEADGEEGGAKVLSFFRVFDLAFFAPGVVLLGAVAWHFRKDVFDHLELLKSVGGAVVVGAVAVAVAFALGLVVAAIARILPVVDVGRIAYRWIHVGQRKTVGRRLSDAAGQPKRPWFVSLPGRARSDLALYFWYMRSTCANVAIAVSLVPFVVTVPNGEPVNWRHAAIAIGVSLLLVIEAGEFDDAMRSAVGIEWRAKDAGG